MKQKHENKNENDSTQNAHPNKRPRIEESQDSQGPNGHNASSSRSGSSEASTANMPQQPEGSHSNRKLAEIDGSDQPKTRLKLGSGVEATFQQNNNELTLSNLTQNNIKAALDILSAV